MRPGEPPESGPRQPIRDGDHVRHGEHAESPRAGWIWDLEQVGTDWAGRVVQIRSGIRNQNALLERSEPERHERLMALAGRSDG